jgi:hypothetical protein
MSGQLTQYQTLNMTDETRTPFAQRRAAQLAALVEQQGAAKPKPAAKPEAPEADEGERLSFAERRVKQLAALQGEPAANLKQSSANDSLEEQYRYNRESVTADYERIKNLVDEKQKLTEKQSALKRYREYLAEYMAEGLTHDNTVLTYCLLWAMDCEEWDWAFELYNYSNANNLESATKRSHIDLLAEGVFKFADAAFKNEDVDALAACRFVEIYPLAFSDNYNIDNKFRRQICRLMGLILEAKEPEKALMAFKKAHEIDPLAGVKGKIAALEKQLTEQPPL